MKAEEIERQIVLKGVFIPEDDVRIRPSYIRKRKVKHIDFKNSPLKVLLFENERVLYSAGIFVRVMPCAVKSEDEFSKLKTQLGHI